MKFVEYEITIKHRHPLDPESWNGVDAVHNEDGTLNEAKVIEQEKEAIKDDPDAFFGQTDPDEWDIKMRVANYKDEQSAPPLYDEESS